jgi:uncharacterized membrane protein
MRLSGSASISALDARFHARFRPWFALGCPAFVAMLGLYALIWRVATSPEP